MNNVFSPNSIIFYNLSFISKLIERVVAKRFSDHLASNGLNEIYQSAYKELHSTETALLKVQNDLLLSIDTMGGAVLVLLDLSAAFDTIDHSKLFMIQVCVLRLLIGLSHI